MAATIPSLHNYNSAAGHDICSDEFAKEMGKMADMNPHAGILDDSGARAFNKLFPSNDQAVSFNFAHIDSIDSQAEEDGTSIHTDLACQKAFAIQAAQLTHVEEQAEEDGTLIHTDLTCQKAFEIQAAQLTHVEEQVFCKSQERTLTTVDEVPNLVLENRIRYLLQFERDLGLLDFLTREEKKGLGYLDPPHLDALSAKKHSIAQLADSKRGKKTHGTCIAALVGKDFIIVSGDGRSKDVEDDTILGGNVIKISMIDTKLICAISGVEEDANYLLDIVNRESHGDDIFAFSKECNKCLKHRERMGRNDPNYTILVFGYSCGEPHMYSTDTRECSPLAVCSIHGTGCAFEFAERYLLGKFHHFHSHDTTEEFANFFRDAYAVTAIETEDCGGVVTLGIVSTESGKERALIRRDQHVFGILSSRFRNIRHLLSRCVIITTYGLKYSIHENEVEKARILQLYRRAQGVNVLGVIRKKKRQPEMIVQVVLFPSSGHLKRSRVKYHKTRRTEQPCCGECVEAYG